MQVYNPNKKQFYLEMCDTYRNIDIFIQYRDTILFFGCIDSLASHTLEMKMEGLVQYGYHTCPLMQKSCSPIRFRIGDDASSEGVVIRWMYP